MRSTNSLRTLSSCLASLTVFAALAQACASSDAPESEDDSPQAGTSQGGTTGGGTESGGQPGAAGNSAAGGAGGGFSGRASTKGSGGAGNGGGGSSFGGGGGGGSFGGTQGMGGGGATGGSPQPPPPPPPPPPPETCGNTICGAGEGPSNCCQDCGCSSGTTCVSNQCICPSASIRITNTMPDATQYCPLTGTYYTQQSTAYINDGEQTGYLPDGGWVEYSGNIGSTFGGAAQCCYLDPCLGDLLCQTPSGWEPCLCAPSFSWSATIVTCGQTNYTLCG
jgi:hypothetical protein